VRIILDHTGAQGFVGASSLERMGVEQSLTELTRQFKSLTLPANKPS
jgi:predicted TIM-barrel enzyme